MIYASRRLIEANPDAIRRFILWGGSMRCVHARQQGRDGEDRERHERLRAPVQAKEYDLTIKMFSTDGKFDAESLATLKRSFADLKLLDTAPDMSKLYTEEYLPKQ